MNTCPVCGARRRVPPVPPLQTRLNSDGVYEVVVAEDMEAGRDEDGRRESIPEREERKRREDPAPTDDGGTGGAVHPYARPKPGCVEGEVEAAAVGTEGGAPEVEVGGGEPAPPGAGEGLLP